MAVNDDEGIELPEDFEDETPGSNFGVDNPDEFEEPQSASEQPDDDAESDPEIKPDNQDEEEVKAQQDSQDDPQVEIADGESVPLSELKNGYLRQKDYTTKTQGLAGERQQFEQAVSHQRQYNEVLKGRHANLVQFMQGLIPDEPSVDLAKTNPAEYNYQKALRDQAINELTQFVEGTQNMAKQDQQINQVEFQRMAMAEEGKLLQALPHLQNPQNRAKFNDNLLTTAKEFGFSEQEIKETVDHRVLSLVYYARAGKAAMRNQMNANRRVSQSKVGRSAPNTRVATGKGNRTAMRRLGQTGSIADAMKIDFA